MKAALYRIHRWLGMSLGILVSLWFASAFVMIYVGFPALTTRERLAGLDPLPTNAWAASPTQAFAATGLTSPPARVRLGTFLGRPVYHFRPADRTPLAHHHRRGWQAHAARLRRRSRPGGPTFRTFLQHRPP